ncbi:hypothetical protein BDY19DRAFT_245438 [Irpex rosettiformis]|uniref:Uncharacterized protein n=1 Tax=Irpex rosettiformis TaxID=378272 RepID=A0ACB8TYZ0_9APHY|nr:hypothetical protein BDY19DRAFT_245438 [Irpex rosettiformis]
MSSKRGRKRNDNLPPNRARDVQRAFRARRAAHLEALEQRVAELEDENNTLRAALNLPPANRQPLGKGPTGKDKPKPRTESPSSGSTRTHSLSPSSLSTVLNPNGQPGALSDSSPWDEGMFGGGREREVQPSPVSNSYPVTPVSSNTSQPPYSFPNQNQSSSRPSVSTYGLQMPQDYPTSTGRPGGEGYSESLFDRRFHFAQSGYSDNSHSNFHAQSPTSAVSLPPHRASPSASLQNLSFAHRRSITEPQALRTALMSGMPGMMGHSHSSSGKGPSASMSETVGHLRAAEFDVDPRVNQLNTLPS